MTWEFQCLEESDNKTNVYHKNKNKKIELEEIQEIELEKWWFQEVKSALKRTKPGKAAGVLEVSPNLLRADMEDTASRLNSCYNWL